MSLICISNWLMRQKKKKIDLDLLLLNIRNGKTVVVL